MRFDERSVAAGLRADEVFHWKFSDFMKRQGGFVESFTASVHPDVNPATKCPP
jgi:hypothetical protein